MNTTDKNQFRVVMLLPLGLAITFAVLSYAFAKTGEPFVLARLPTKFGFDFRDFHWAARFLLEGRSPWEWERFVTPPWSAFLMRPLANIPPREAIDIFFPMNIVFVVGGSFLFCISFTSKDGWRPSFFTSIVVILFSHPVYFLLQRGNIDGMVFFLIALGVFLSTYERIWHTELASGLLFALACHLKIYPILLLFPILASRRWRLAAFTVISMVILAVATVDLWPAFIEKLFLRHEIYTVQENGSLVNTLFPIILIPGYLLLDTVFEGINTIVFLGYGIYFVSIFLLLYCSFRFANRFQAYGLPVLSALYIPFMLLVPSLAYQYEYVNLLAFVPLICWLEDVRILNRPHLHFLVIGLVLSNTHSTALFFLTQNPIAYFIPGFGLVLVAFVCLKLACSMPELKN